MSRKISKLGLIGVLVMASCVGIFPAPHALAISAAEAIPEQTSMDTNWVDSWSAPPDQSGPPLASGTVRQVVRVSVGGTKVRIRLSNLFGVAPITLGPVHIARHALSAGIEENTDRRLSFGGKSTVIIAKGEEQLSDPLDMDVTSLQELSVSMYVPHRIAAPTLHGTAVQTAYLKPGADLTAALHFPTKAKSDSRFFLTDVEVLATSQTTSKAIAVLGDSVSDGIGSTPDRNLRWPDRLAMRLQANAEHHGVAVINSGISGNRILHDGVDPFVGPSALARFERDILTKPGVSWVILFEGVNDITAANVLRTRAANVSAEQIIEGMKRLAEAAHERGIKVFGATLLPYEGANLFGPKAPVYTSSGEVKRQAVNAWMRTSGTSGTFDGVIDTDLALRDPAHPSRLLPAFDSGDHIHPNDAGHKALAEALDLNLIR